MTKVKDVIKCLELFAPIQLQEKYDNSGLIIGDKNSLVNGVIICLDINLDVVNEAIKNNCNLIISHHPFIFSGIKKITGNSLQENILIKSIKNDISIYACHTSIDNVYKGVSYVLAEKLGIKELKILAPKSDELLKLVTFCPESHIEKVKDAIFSAGAGSIGDYDRCSFVIEGNGTFRALKGADPYVGKVGEDHTEKELRIETVFPLFAKNKVLNALLSTHPYEEVAYDIYQIKNKYEKAGAGIIGVLPEKMSAIIYLEKVKKILKIPVIKHSELLDKEVRKVAVCGGSGSQLIGSAIDSGADIYLTGDIKYHQFTEGEDKMIIADIGHYESEQYVKDLLYSIIIKNFSKFAVRISKEEKNPVSYL